MGLLEVARSWEELGRRDPLWAILTLPGKSGRRWDADEFFATGREEVARLAALLDRLGVPARRRRALDFGCGVGRLTQALVGPFEEADGVDVAASMLELANGFNRHGARCRYHLNVASDLALFPDAGFDLVYSAYVLQHVPVALAEGYVREFVRLLAPGGVAVFQLPEAPRRGATAPLPPGAFRAELRVTGTPRSVGAGESATVAVRAANRGVAAWPARGDGNDRFQVTAGNHWLDASGAVAVNDDGRAALPSDVAPGESAELELTVTAPATPGPYLLEVDLVQEGVAWFATHGSPVARAEVEVVAARGAGRAPDAVAGSLPPPRMEMHGTPREEVERWIVSAGGNLLATTGLLSTGAEFLERDWTAWVYVVGGPAARRA